MIGNKEMFVPIRKLINKTQILFVRTFPLLRVVLFKVALPGMKYDTPHIVTLTILCLLVFPIAVFHSLYNRITGKFIIDNVQTCITTLCTLKCKECVTMIPLYSKPQNMNCTNILSDIDKLLKIVDYIVTFGVSGGEPFLHGNLAEIVNKMLLSNKISYIGIATTGMVIPKKEIIDVLKNNRIKVIISGYPEKLVPNVSKFIKILRDNGINYGYSKNQKWKYYGDKNFKNRSIHENRELFSLCISSLCNVILDGKYYVCIFSVGGIDLGIIPQNEDDFVNIRELSVEEAKTKLLSFRRKKIFFCCNYCDGNTFLSKTIEPAEQIYDHI